MIPRYDECFPVILKLLSDEQLHTVDEIEQVCAEFFETTDEELRIPTKKGTRTQFKDRIGWACTHLNKAGLISTKPRSKVYKITDAGKLEDPDKITELYLHKFESYCEFRLASETRNLFSEQTLHDLVDTFLKSIANEPKNLTEVKNFFKQTYTDVFERFEKKDRQNFNMLIYAIRDRLLVIGKIRKTSNDLFELTSHNYTPIDSEKNHAADKNSLIDSEKKIDTRQIPDGQNFLLQAEKDKFIRQIVAKLTEQFGYELSRADWNEKFDGTVSNDYMKFLLKVILHREVQKSELENFLEILDQNEFNKAMFVTDEIFSADAIEFAKSTGKFFLIDKYEIEKNLAQRN